MFFIRNNWNIKTKEGSKLEVMRHILNKPMCIAVFKEDEIDCNVYTSLEMKSLTTCCLLSLNNVSGLLNLSFRIY